MHPQESSLPVEKSILMRVISCWEKGLKTRSGSGKEKSNKDFIYKIKENKSLEESEPNCTQSRANDKQLNDETQTSNENCCDSAKTQEVNSQLKESTCAKEQTTISTELQHYKSRQGIASKKGMDYETYLIMLGLVRGERDTKSFELGSNVDGLGAFDDIVLSFKNKLGINSEPKKVIFLQAKHVTNVSAKKISMNDFCDTVPSSKWKDLSLKTYLSSFVKIQNSKEKKNSFLQGDDKYVIYTNAILSEEFDGSKIVEVTDSFFSTESKGTASKTFKFKLDNSNSELIQKLASFACEHRIESVAEKVVQLTLNDLNENHKFVNVMGDEIIKMYHVFLSKTLIDVTERKEKSYLKGTFSSYFLDEKRTDEFEEKLRKDVIYYFARNSLFSKKKKNAKNRSSNRNEDEEHLLNQAVEMIATGKENSSLIEELSSILTVDNTSKMLKFVDEKTLQDKKYKNFYHKLKSKVNNLAYCKFNIPDELVIRKLKEETMFLSLTFGNIVHKVKDYGFFTNKLTKLIEQYKTEQVIKIDKSMVGRGKILCESFMRSFDSLIGNLLLSKEEQLQFGNKESFQGKNLELFKHLEEQLWESSGVKLSELRFIVKYKAFQRLSLKIEDEDTDNVTHFLSKLEVATGQANETDMKEIIKEELKLLYGLTKDEADINFLKLKEQAEEYRETEKNNHYLKKGNKFLSTIARSKITFNLRDSVTSFTGREERLRKLNSKMKQVSRGKVSALSQIVVITGPGGIGKTELARQFVQKYGTDFENIIWMDATNINTLSQSFCELAIEKLGIKVDNEDKSKREIKFIVEDVFKCFSKRHSQSLFVFDSVVDYNELKTFLPSYPVFDGSKKPQILITSQVNQSMWKQWGVAKSITLSVLLEEEAVSFVKKTLNLKKQSVSQDKLIKELAVDTLKKFPLALQQAVAYIKEENENSKIRGKREYTMKNYIEDFKKQTQKLLDSKVFMESFDNDYEKTTFTTWNMTIDKIKTDKSYGQLAINILKIMSYFASNNIPIEHAFLKLTNGDEDSLWKAVGLLHTYSMIRLKGGLADIHGLVQEVIRLNISLENEEQDILREALVLLQGQNRVDEFDNNGCKSNLNSALSVYKYASHHANLVEEFNSIPLSIVDEMSFHRMFIGALEFANSTLKKFENIGLSRKHISVLTLKLSLAGILFKMKEEEHALQLCKEVEKELALLNEHEKESPLIILLNYHNKCLIARIQFKADKFEQSWKTLSTLYDLHNESNIFLGYPLLVSLEYSMYETLYWSGQTGKALEFFQRAEKRLLAVGNKEPSEPVSNRRCIENILSQYTHFRTPHVYCTQIQLGMYFILFLCLHGSIANCTLKVSHNDKN